MTKTIEWQRVCLNINTIFPCIVIPIMQMKRSHDCFIIITLIPLLVKQHPWSHIWNGRLQLVPIAMCPLYTKATRCYPAPVIVSLLRNRQPETSFTHTVHLRTWISYLIHIYVITNSCLTNRVDSLNLWWRWEWTITPRDISYVDIIT